MFSSPKISLYDARNSNGKAEIQERWKIMDLMRLGCGRIRAEFDCHSFK
jgi:hypothetical protein